MIRRAVRRALLLGTAALVAAGCGDDEPTGSAMDSCDADTRLAIEGRVGPVTYERTLFSSPFEAAADSDFFGLILEDGSAPHRIVFSTRGQTEAGTFRDAIGLRLNSGAANASTFSLVSRPASVPCDPAEGVICASYGIDSSGDGQLIAADEVVYPVAVGNDRGTMTVTQISGNEISARFSITFGAQASGDAEGGQEGGQIEGCFRLNMNSDLSRVN